MLCMNFVTDYSMSAQNNTILHEEIASLNMMDDMETDLLRDQSTQTTPASYVTPYVTPYAANQGAAAPAVAPAQETAVVTYYNHYPTMAPLSDDLIQSKFVSPSVYQKKGFILQFVNNNANCSPTLIGGTRTNEADVRKIPSYIATHEAHIKKLAVRTLVKHLQETQCATACLETLSDEDFGVSYSVASLSGKGMSLNPSRRHEAPLFYCHLQGFMEPGFVQQSQHGVETAHVINCYVHILPANQRRNHVITRAKAARIEANQQPAPAIQHQATNRPANTMNPPPSNKMKSSPRARSQSRARPYPRGNSNQNHSQNQHAPPPKPTIGGVIKQAQKNHANQASPPLPNTKAPTWVSQADDLPDSI